MKDWGYSLVLIIGYLGLFQYWSSAKADEILWTCLLWGAVFGAALEWARRSRYFLSRTEIAIHGAVIVDVLLEGLLISDHAHAGFWLCGGGFAVVIGGYRAYLLRGATRGGDCEAKVTA